MASIRVTRECTEVLGIASSDLRVTRICTEIFGIASSALRVSRINVEYLREYNTPNLSIPFADDLNISDSVLGYLNDSIPIIDSLTITDTVDITLNVISIIDYLGITDTFYKSAIQIENIINTLTITDEIILDRNTHITSNILVISQFVDLNNEIDRPLGHSLSISDSVVIDTTQFAPKIIDTLNITDSISTVTPKNLIVENELTITDTTAGIFQYNLDIIDEFDIIYVDTENLIIYRIMDTVERHYTATRIPWNFLTLSDNIQVVNEKASATTDSASNTLTVTDSVDVSRSLNNSLSISDSITVTQGKLTKDTLTISDSVGIIREINKQPSDNLVLEFSIEYTHIQPHTHHEYAPFIGTTTDSNAPTPPSLSEPSRTIYTNVELSWPVDDPTDILTFDGPELQNQDQLDHTRINRETRGGTLTIFADPDWPKRERLNLRFIGLSETEGQNLLNFLRDTLGQQIKLRDWEGNEWTVIILTPDNPIVREGYCQNTINLDFESATIL